MLVLLKSLSVFLLVLLSACSLSPKYPDGGNPDIDRNDGIQKAESSSNTRSNSSSSNQSTIPTIDLPTRRSSNQGTAPKDVGLGDRDYSIRIQLPNRN